MGETVCAQPSPSAPQDVACLFFQTLIGGRTLGLVARADSLDHFPVSAREFTTTHWSVVLAARDTASPQAEAALAELCRTYWYPL